MGRPIINMNQAKWIQTGRARIYIGNTYGDAGGGTGVIVGVGTSWSDEMVGRYFAVDEATE